MPMKAINAINAINAMAIELTERSPLGPFQFFHTKYASNTSASALPGDGRQHRGHCRPSRLFRRQCVQPRARALGRYSPETWRQRSRAWASLGYRQRPRRTGRKKWRRAHEMHI